MDNITHSLVGITVGELWYLSRKDKRSAGAKRSAIVATSLVANNLPDLDFVYTHVADPELGYLLHHRGHTHTIAFTLLLMALPWLAVKLFPRQLAWLKKQQELIVVAGLGILLHVSLDALNSYGVHPFWPVWNRWFFLDTLFILEPLAWLSLLPAILFSVKKRGFRIFLGVCFFGILALIWGTPIVPWYAALTATAVALGVWYHSQHRPELARYRFAGSIFLGVVLVFGVSSQLVRQRYLGKAQTEYPDRKVVDIVLSPLPANPLCWLLISVQTGSNGDTYYLRRGLAALWPSLVSASQCPLFRDGRGAAPLHAVDEKETTRYRWAGEMAGDGKELRNLDENHCRVRGFLRFARVPFVVDQGDYWLVGDLRFDFGTRGSFSQFVFPKIPDRCPDTSVPWTPAWYRW